MPIPIEKRLTSNYWKEALNEYADQMLYLYVQGRAMMFSRKIEDSDLEQSMRLYY